MSCCPGFRISRAPRWMLDHSCRRGFTTASFDHVVSVLGEPAKRPRGPEKTFCEWLVHTPHGPVSVYDYCFAVDPRTVPDGQCVWHVGAHNELAARWIAELVDDEGGAA